MWSYPRARENSPATARQFARRQVLDVGKLDLGVRGNRGPGTRTIFFLVFKSSWAQGANPSLAAAPPAARRVPPSLQSTTILARVAAGDSTAVSQCLEIYGPLVWSMARRWLRDDSLAEDVVQEVFIQIWKSAPRFDPKIASERTWIATIARRRLIDLRRRQGSAARTEELEDDIQGADKDGISHAIRDEQVQEARDALAKLRPEERRLISLSVLDGLSHSQIATHTGLPLGTVKTHVRTGLERLRGLLGVRKPDTRGGARS